MAALPCPLSFPPRSERRFDLVCLGRVLVDLYAQQYGAPLEDATSFAKYLGGSSANLAFGAARLGLRCALISRVGDDQLGAFVRAALAREGCDTALLQTDPARPTALALLGIKSRHAFPLLFVRDHCADMAIDPALIDPGLLTDCRALAVTGTHLSTAPMRAVVEAVIAQAQQAGAVTVLDLDYRPVLWGLTRRSEGAQRFLDAPEVTAVLQAWMPSFDLLVGTEEEFLIAGGFPDDLTASLREVRRRSTAVLVVKRGPHGCIVIDGEVPDTLEAARHYPGDPVDVLNVLGAGDAFLAGLMTGLLDARGWDEAARIANACGAIVVTRHACSAAMPTRAELDFWLASPHPPADGFARQLAHLHRVTVPRQSWRDLCILAFDHRDPLDAIVDATCASKQRIPALKRLLLDAVRRVEGLGLPVSTGALIDGGDGADALNDATGQQRWVGRPIELPGSRPLRFDADGGVGTALVHWPAEHIVKCLVHYDPDDPIGLRLEQERQLLELDQATEASGHQWLVELIIPNAAQLDDAEARVLRSIERLYNVGIRPDWWKLEPLSRKGWKALETLLAARDPYCRGALILGLNRSVETLERAFGEAVGAVVNGFAVGRTVWAEPVAQWLCGEIDDEALVAAVATRYEALIRSWLGRGQRPPDKD